MHWGTRQHDGVPAEVVWYHTQQHRNAPSHPTHNAVVSVCVWGGGGGMVCCAAKTMCTVMQCTTSDVTQHPTHTPRNKYLCPARELCLSLGVVGICRCPGIHGKHECSIDRTTQTCPLRHVCQTLCVVVRCHNISAYLSVTSQHHRSTKPTHLGCAWLVQPLIHKPLEFVSTVGMCRVVFLQNICCTPLRIVPVP